MDAVHRTDSTIRITAHPRGNEGWCPKCGTASRRVHSRYRRRPADTAIGAHPVILDLVVRRFFCDYDSCDATTFAEQVPGLTQRWARRTTVLDTMIEAIGLAVAGRAGARLAARLGIHVSRDTLLRVVRAIPDRPIETTPILGIDDFALRRGHVYGTVVVDLTSGRPIDLLPDRTSDTVSTWLQAHPGAEIVCRDRAGAYADAVRIGAPDAVQVADRWHLWRNLIGAVEKTVIRHRKELSAPTDRLGDDAVIAEAPDGRLVVRTCERHAAVHELHTQGMSISGIARKLNLNRRTVRRFVHAPDIDELLATSRMSGATLLTGYEPYLRERFAAGCTDAAQLTREITERGYRGSAQTVRRFLQPLRTAERARPTLSRTPSIRQVTMWLTCRPDDLADKDSQLLTEICERSPALATVREHIRCFAGIMVERRGHDLTEWMTDVDATGSPALRSFVTGLRRDLEAVTAGLTLVHNSGPVEGHVNRIKMLKRQMYGRANLDLLRKRVIHLE
nr:ISL3 family transposase [Rhodococcus sp. RDE2]